MDATIPLPPTTTSEFHAPGGIPTTLADTARAILDPFGLGAPPSHLPIIPENARRRHAVFVPADHRFKAAARFLQALWREDRDCRSVPTLTAPIPTASAASARVSHSPPAAPAPTS